MSTKQNKTHTRPNRYLRALLKTTNVLLLTLLAGGLLFAVPGFAQPGQAANTTPASIVGTVVDATTDPIPDATVFLRGPAGDPLKVATKDDGSFAFHDVTPGIAYQITVSAEGFADWSSSVTAETGQEKTVADINLRRLAEHRAVTVNYSAKEVATQQLKA